MKTISRNQRMQLAFTLRWLAACVPFATLHAQSLTLKDTRGRAVEIRPTSATDMEVVGIRTSDQKEVKIPLNTLDAESRKSVEGWKKLTGRLPRKEFVAKFTKDYGDRKKYTVNFKMPEGSYNTTPDKTSIKLVFDIPNNKDLNYKGDFTLAVTSHDRKEEDALAEILRDFNSAIKRDLERMSPSERQLKEPMMKLETISHGEYSGYSRTTEHSVQTRTANGKFMISTYLRPLNLPSVIEQPLIPEDVPRILETLEIINGH